MKKTKHLSLLLSGALALGLLAGCGGGTETASDTFELTLNIASEPMTIDPALNSAMDGSIMTSHMFEGLMRWEDSGAETPGSNGS